jgi:hypothetical protein
MSRRLGASGHHQVRGRDTSHWRPGARIGSGGRGTCSAAAACRLHLLRGVHSSIGRPGARLSSGRRGSPGDTEASGHHLRGRLLSQGRPGARLSSGRSGTRPDAATGGLNLLRGGDSSRGGQVLASAVGDGAHVQATMRPADTIGYGGDFPQPGGQVHASVVGGGAHVQVHGPPLCRESVVQGALDCCSSCAEPTGRLMVDSGFAPGENCFLGTLSGLPCAARIHVVQVMACSCAGVLGLTFKLSRSYWTPPGR